MKFPYNHFIFLFISILLTIVNGKKSIINLKTRFPVYSIQINHKKSKIFYDYNLSKNNQFPLDCEPGEKISLNITSNIIEMEKNDDFIFIFLYNNETSYFYNKKNISLISFKKFKNKNINFLIEFYIPYEIYCDSHDDIIINESINAINFELNSNIFIKNKKIQQNEMLQIKILDIYYSNDNNLSILPLMNFNKSNNYNLNTIFYIYSKNQINLNNSLIIKYKGISSLDMYKSINECSIKIIKKENYSIQNKKRNLQEKLSEEFYIFEEIFDNKNAQNDLEEIVELFNMGVNVFNISDPFFNDLCIHYENNSHDYVLEDRIEFFYQNYSLCNSSCNLSQIYMENYSYSCICFPVIEEGDNTHHKREHSMELNEEFSMEGLTKEFSDLFFETNFEVIRCFFNVLKDKVIINNYGFIINTIFLIIQFFASLCLFRNIKDIRIYVYKDLLKCKFNPPKRKGIPLVNQNEYGDNNSNINNKFDLRIEGVNNIINNESNQKNSKSNSKTYGTELLSIKGIIPINSNNNNIIISNKINEIDYYNNSLMDNKTNKKEIKFRKKSNNYDKNDSNIKFNESYISSKRKINIKNRNNDYFNEKQDNSNNDFIIVHKRKNLKKYEEDDNKTNFNFSSDENNNFENYKYVHNSKNKKRNYENKFFEKDINTNQAMILSENYSQNGTINTGGIKYNIQKESIKEKKYKNNEKEFIQPYKKINYDQDELDGLDYEEALVYDKRTFCQLFCKQIKERQLIHYTFFVKDKLKPLSIKIIVLIFNFSCYLVVNGFLFNENYVMKILRRTTKSFYYYIVDSTNRIIYSSIIGGLINMIIGLLFKADKSLRKVQNKYQNNPILLHGEIVKIYKSTKCIYIVFTIFNFVLMILFIFYLFCFCGVYRNCQSDWLIGCFVVIVIMQLFPVLVSFLLAFLRKVGLVCKIEFLFKISSWIIDNM